MPRPVIIFLLGTLATVSVSEVVQATDITILNAGFEEPELDDGTWVTGGPGWEFGIYYADDRTVWIEGADGSATDGGVWNPNFDIGFTDGAYAGENAGWAFSEIDIDAGLSQILEDKLLANTQYHLQVQVGNAIYNQTDFTADYRIELLAGDILLATDTGESPEADLWEPHSLTYNSGPNPAQEGEQLAIRLIAVEYDDCVDGGCEVDFDEVTLTASGDRALAAGDADQDYDFDQLDLVQVQVAAKYLTEQAATWGEGDWDGAPGGTAGSPPPGDGRFNQLDIIGALAAGTYLTGPYAAVEANGQLGDGQTSVVYNAGTGEVAVDAPAGVELSSINIDSAAGIFMGDPAQNLGGSFDNDADANIFKATFGSSFASLSFGHVAQAGLSQDFVLSDLTVVGSLAGGGELGDVDLVYVPEPTSVLLLSIGIAIGVLHFGRKNR